MGTRAVNAHPDVQRAAGETHRMRQPGGHSMGLEPCEFDNALEDLPQARYVLVLQSQLVSKGMDQAWLPQRPATGNVFSSNEIGQDLSSKLPGLI